VHHLKVVREIICYGFSFYKISHCPSLAANLDRLSIILFTTTNNGGYIVQVRNLTVCLTFYS
jgi:hypothetical protein